MNRILLAAVVLSTGCASTIPETASIPPLVPVATVEPARPQDAFMRADLTQTLDSIMNAAVRDGAAPGGALAVGRYGRIVHMKGYGRLDPEPKYGAVDENTIYDMASLTKVIATTTASMVLEEQGLLDLDRTVASYLPGFNAPDKAAITVRMIVTHRGGLEAFAALYKSFRGREEYLAQINSRPLKSAPGTATVYSDWDMILQQLIIERITGQTLDTFVGDKVFKPLGMTSTLFNPDSSLFARIAPTELDTATGGLMRGHIHGSVHDENAFKMGGVSGHAGLFSTAKDLSIFAQMLLNGGSYNGVRILRPETLARWTVPQSKESSRALGWDTPSKGSSSGNYFSPRSFGHTGYTGTSIWMDPERGLFVILLTNRVNPTRANQKQVPLRRAVADAAQRGIVDAPLIDWEKQR
ncbi:MAG TPA: serine hydrolase [Gemmatimonadaceae bacterium]|nr:serine hydrolase [Gemmatimonadaceae bacterium]